MQSPDEINRIILDWQELYAPKNLRVDEQTALLLGDYIAKNEGKLVSFAGLSRAAKALGSRILIPEKSERQKAIEAAKKGDEKMRNAFFKSISPDAQKPLVDHKKAEVDKKLKGVQDEISKEINSHFVDSLGLRNFAKTEHEQNLLRNVLDLHDTSTMEGAKQALAAVIAEKHKLNRGR